MDGRFNGWPPAGYILGDWPVFCAFRGTASSLEAKSKVPLSPWSYFTFWEMWQLDERVSEMGLSYAVIGTEAEAGTKMTKQISK